MEFVHRALCIKSRALGVPSLDRGGHKSLHGLRGYTGEQNPQLRMEGFVRDETVGPLSQTMNLELGC